MPESDFFKWLELKGLSEDDRQTLRGNATKYKSNRDSHSKCIRFYVINYSQFIPQKLKTLGYGILKQNLESTLI